MPTCPKCGKEIDYLKHYQSGEAYYNLKLIDGEIEYHEQEFIDDGKVNDYECPECTKTLFTHEVDAIAFLEEGK